MENFGDLTQDEKDVIYDKRSLRKDDNFTELSLFDFAKDIVGLFRIDNSNIYVKKNIKKYKDYEDKGTNKKSYKGKINKHLRQETKLIEKYNVERKNIKFKNRYK